MKKCYRLLMLLLLPLRLAAQADSLVVAASPWELGGYVKNLQTLLFFSGNNTPLLQDNFFHHRLNLRYQPGDRWELQAGLRTRLFYGDLVRLNSGYAAQIDAAANDWLDLSRTWVNDGQWVGHSVFDRAFVAYSARRWELRLGRQRVNWGISTIWNPNDIFNAFAFTDFDYEERPGSDALRLRYFTGFAGSVELAARAGRSWQEAAVAGRWVFNRGGYDWQLIGGYARRDWLLGGGWAGNLGNAGFKGEWTYFYHLPAEGQRHNLAATLGIDYVFGSGLYGNWGILYNSNGQTGGSIVSLFDFELSARNLYPYRWALLSQASYPVTPLLNAGLALIYSPNATHPLFANPSLALSMADNWSLDLVGQVVMEKNDTQGYRSPLQAFFLRLKFSY